LFIQHRKGHDFTRKARDFETFKDQKERCQHEGERRDEPGERNISFRLPTLDVKITSPLPSIYLTSLRYKYYPRVTYQIWQNGYISRLIYDPALFENQLWLIYLVEALENRGNRSRGGS